MRYLVATLLLLALLLPSGCGGGKPAKPTSVSQEQAQQLEQQRQAADTAERAREKSLPATK